MYNAQAANTHVVENDRKKTVLKYCIQEMKYGVQFYYQRKRERKLGEMK